MFHQMRLFSCTIPPVNPDETSVYTINDGIKGKGQYVGVYMAWGVHNNGWWGEGEIKFFMDGDSHYPTICGTGTEDYLGSYDFGTNRKNPAESESKLYRILYTLYRPAPGNRGIALYNVMRRFFFCSFKSFYQDLHKRDSNNTN